jgi:hypothetical protein
MKKKKGMLTDDKTRIGYQDAGEVKRKKIIYNLNEDSGNLETEGGTYIREALEDKLKRLNSDRERLAESGVKDTTKEDLKIMIEIEEIENSLKDIDGVIERDKKYSGGMLSDDKDRMSYKEGGKGIEALRKEAPEVVARMGYEEGGDVDSQMSMMMPMEEAMPAEEAMPMEETMMPDEQMEDEYLDFIVSQSLSSEEETSLMNKLEADPELSVMFDKLMETATEFSGSGPVEGPGSEVSDSIPARLSDGEFVITAKATDEIGSDNLQNMMDSAEEVSDDRKQVAMGGSIQDESKVDQFGKSIDEDLVDEEIRRSMLSVNPRLQ